MRSFSTEPNRITWNDDVGAELVFLQEEDWVLPQVAVSANGERLVARIDTGGDLFSVPWSIAEKLNIEPVARTVGWFAGGRRAITAFGILPRLDLGSVTIESVPVSINSFEHPILGTGLLRQFRPTIDYPSERLLLEPRKHGEGTDGFPFLIAGTHLLIARGAVNGIAMQFLVDSGLEVTDGGCFLAPESTLRVAGIDVPETRRVEGGSGAGTSTLDIGEFPVDELTLGTATRRDVTGLTGIFPKQLARPSTIGFPLGGLVSHHFLRHYRWTLDFDGMRMRLADP